MSQGWVCVAYDLVATQGGVTLMLELLVPTERWPVLTAGSVTLTFAVWECEKSLLPTLNAWQADPVYNVRASKRSVVNTCRAGSGSLPTPPSRSTQEPVGIGVTCLAPCSSMQLDRDLGEGKFSRASFPLSAFSNFSLLVPFP